MTDVELISIYCDSGAPDLTHVKRAFQITPSLLVGKMLGKVSSSGREIDPEVANKSESIPIQSRVQRTSIYLKRTATGRMVGRNMRTLLWWVGPWKSLELDHFIAETDPDLIFMPLYSRSNMNRLDLHVSEQAQVPIVAYVSDDVYSLRQFSLSPLYWLRRIGSRRLIRELVSKCEVLYVISDLQKEEYERTLGIECRILTKLEDFSGEPPKLLEHSPEQEHSTVFTYAGNIGNGRWKSLQDIGHTIDLASKNGNHGWLHIYTMTPLTRQMKQAFKQVSSIRVHSAVPASQLQGIFERSDVLVLAEPTDLRGRLSVRHSFSTKIVEYLHAGRPILLRAASGQASVEYLREARAALVATSNEELKQQVQELMVNPALRTELARNGWKLGQEKHDRGKELPKLEVHLKQLAEAATTRPTRIKPV